MGREELLFVACDQRHEYLSGYSPPAALERLLINEVMASQDRVLRDSTDLPCPQRNPDCGWDDFIELCNGSAEVIDLSGLWLSDRLFQPQEWQFPAGSFIEPGEHLIVWTDGDGGRCPRPPASEGDEQQCPDPTDVSRKEFHTSFNLGRDRDQVYLHDRAENGFGVIRAVEFALQEPNVSLSLIPDCTPGGSYRLTPLGSPGAPNPGLPDFLRGDANGDCGVNITDPTFTLNFLFLGGPAPICADAADADDSGDLLLTDAVFALNFLFLDGPEPPAPGPAGAGSDPSADALPECAGVHCQP